MVDACATSQVPSYPPPRPSMPVSRKLIPNLPSRGVAKKIKEAERLADAGERELAFYLNDFKARGLFKNFSCQSFSEYIAKRTGIGIHRATDLARVGKKLLELPELDDAFARGEIPWSAVRAAASAASPDTDAQWAEYARTHLVEDVEHRAAQTRAHESPRRRGRWDGRPVRFRYTMSVSAEVHQAFEFWRSHRRHFEWSEKRKALAYRPELDGEALEDAAPPVQAPPPAAPAPSKHELSRLSDFQGQRRVVENISLALEAARRRGELPPPILLAGPPGLGKSTLSKLIARELGSTLHQAQGPSLVDLGSLVGILPDLEKGSVLFIDEIHRLPAAVAEMLYQALDEGALSIPVVAGARTRLVKIRLEPFVLVAATTEESLLPAPLRSRFAIRERLSFYAKEDLEHMAASAARAMGIELTAEGAAVLARGARGTPRLLLAHLARARDLAQTEGAPITAGLARRALERAGIDRTGLSETDRRILEVLLECRRPVGARSLSDILGESPRTVADVYEPYLLREGYLARTWRGRSATEKAGRALLIGAIDHLEIDFGDIGRISKG